MPQLLLFDDVVEYSKTFLDDHGETEHIYGEVGMLKGNGWVTIHI